jgi:hypothetical protein
MDQTVWFDYVEFEWKTTKGVAVSTMAVVKSCCNLDLIALIQFIHSFEIHAHESSFMEDVF